MSKKESFILLTIVLFAVFMAACENPLVMNNADNNDGSGVDNKVNEYNEETYNESTSNNNDEVSDEKIIKIRLQSIILNKLKTRLKI